MTVTRLGRGTQHYNPRSLALIGSAAVTLFAGAAAPAASVPVVDPHPAIVQPGESATLTVRGLATSSVEAHLAGATAPGGAPLPWVALRRTGRSWKGLLPEPSLRGVYRIELRIGPGGRVMTSHSWLLRVLDPGTLARPRFATPEAVADWWVRAVHPDFRVVALKRWPRPAFDRRDLRLHRLMVIAYSRVGDRRVDDRRGIFLTAFRERYGGAWRLLEASVYP
jgi:hypothetical protein